MTKLKWSATTWTPGLVLENVSPDLVIPEQEILIEAIERWLREDWK